MARTKVETDMINFGATEIDRRKNYIVNPGMRVSQENGATSGDTNGYYPCDQWFLAHSQDGTLTTQQVASASPAGSPNRLRVTVSSQDATIGASQHAVVGTRIEGLRASDLLFGGASAKQLVLRFGLKAPAGTIGVALVNGASNRSFVRDVTVAGGDANTDTVQTVVFPGDTSGTWATGNTTCLRLFITLAAGSTYQTTADAWQAGNYFGTSSTSNGIGTGSAVFEIFDVGLYADVDGTGVAPPFVLPHIDDDIRSCQRYFQNMTVNSMFASMDVTTGNTYYAGRPFPVALRDTPSVSLTSNMTGFGSPSVFTADTSALSIEATASATAIARVFSASAEIDARLS